MTIPSQSEDSATETDATGRRRISRGLSSWPARLIDFLYPPTCIQCGTPTGEPYALCAQCWREIPFIERPYCERLGTPLPVNHDGPLLSPAAIAEPPAFNRARSVAVYDDDKVRALVSRLKYGDRPELARLMGRMMAAAGRELLSGCDLVIPVPLHRWRLWCRRYNQAAVLAESVASHCQRPYSPFSLQRVRYTRSQTKLTKAQRRENIRGAFAVAAEARMQVAGAHIVLIDDVLTTGTTANAAARVLLRAGAASVDLLTFARAVKH